MEIELVTIGTELLLGHTLDTNASFLGRRLAEHGIRVMRHTTVDDDPARMRTVLDEALQRTPLILTTGGLGPTRDDISREAAADVMAMPLAFDDGVWSALTERYRRLARPLPDANRPQAMVPTGATVLPNQWGTAPGLWLENARGAMIMLPGVPFEMERLFDQQVLPRLLGRRMGDAVVIRSRTLRTAGIAESALAEKIGALEAALYPVTLAYLPQTGGVDLRLTIWQRVEAEAEELLGDAMTRLKRMVSPWWYGEGEVDLAAVLLQKLTERGLSFAVAESCTGGMLAARLTAIPDASAVFLGGIVSYANEAKSKLLDVEPEVLLKYGAVSRESVAGMTAGVVQAFGADVAVAITGIAGPGGGSEEKPVGTVWFGYHLPGKSEEVRVAFPGTRQEIRERAVNAALVGLYQRLSAG